MPYKHGQNLLYISSSLFLINKISINLGAADLFWGQSNFRLIISIFIQKIKQGYPKTLFSSILRSFYHHLHKALLVSSKMKLYFMFSYWLKSTGFLQPSQSNLDIPKKNCSLIFQSFDFYYFPGSWEYCLFLNKSIACFFHTYFHRHIYFSKLVSQDNVSAGE